MSQAILMPRKEASEPSIPTRIFFMRTPQILPREYSRGVPNSASRNRGPVQSATHKMRGLSQGAANLRTPVLELAAGRRSRLDGERRTLALLGRDCFVKRWRIQPDDHRVRLPSIGLAVELDATLLDRAGCGQQGDALEVSHQGFKATLPLGIDEAASVPRGVRHVVPGRLKGDAVQSQTLCHQRQQLRNLPRQPQPRDVLSR